MRDSGFLQAINRGKIFRRQPLCVVAKHKHKHWALVLTLSRIGQKRLYERFFSQNMFK